ncbi:MAG TPA: ECF-type sigma factor [Gemmatimonadaceae bacterium]|nr:ECF-type sigma factor [Gemmatimonadaceae bacterium]
MSAQPDTAQPDTTQLLLDARAGDRAAFDRLFAHVYDALREIAHHRLARYRPGETLATTALVHEAYLRLVDQARVDVRDRSHFLALASRAMRFVLVDYARAHTAQKRGGRERDLPLAAVQVAADERADDLLALAEAVERLAAVSPRLGDVVEYRFFGGLTFDEIAETTGLSVPTVKRDWARARTWLYRSMQPADQLQR